MTNDLASIVGVHIQATTQRPTTPETIHELHKYIDEAEDWVKALVAAVNLALDCMDWFVPDFVIDKVHSKTKELTRTADIQLAAARTSVDRIGKPWTLRAAADEWSNSVKKRLSPLSGLLSTSQIRADQKFEGQSADAYNAIRWDYHDALDKLAQFIDPISTGLYKFASAIDKNAMAQGIAILSLIAAIVSACCGMATAATGYGLIVGLGAAALCFAAFAGAWMSAGTEMDTAAQEVVNSWDLTFADWEFFGGKEWPYPMFEEAPVATSPGAAGDRPDRARRAAGQGLA